MLALIPLKGTLLLGPGEFVRLSGSGGTTPWVQPWMGEALAAAATLYVVWRLLQRYKKMENSHVEIAALIATLFVCGISFEVFGITVGTVIMLLGYAASNRVLLGLGNASLLHYISAYYYQMDATLLEKSLDLLVVGVVLVAVRWLIRRVTANEVVVGHG